jgi:hypothetical protein
VGRARHGVTEGVQEFGTGLEVDLDFIVGLGLRHRLGVLPGQDQVAAKHMVQAANLRMSLMDGFPQG